MHRFQTWRDALHAAGSQRSVNKVMRDYANALPKAIRAALPESAQDALTEPIDVQEAAVTLLHAELANVGSGENLTFLHEIAHTFAAAAVRFRTLPDKSTPNAKV